MNNTEKLERFDTLPATARAGLNALNMLAERGGAWEVRQYWQPQADAAKAALAPFDDNIESPSAALIAATPAPPPVVPSPFSVLLGLLTTLEDEERGAARRLAGESIAAANHFMFARAAALAQQAAISDALASGIHLARVELRNVLDKLCAAEEKGEA